MSLGPGRYDDTCTAVREALRARGVVLIVRAGKHGDGFSAQLTAEDVLALPTVLRQVADQIEADQARIAELEAAAKAWEKS